MKNYKYKILALILITGSFIGCQDEKTDEGIIEVCPPAEKLTGERKDLNISIFLDLSDRISPTFNPSPSMEFYQRDLGYINAISSAFESHLRNKRTIMMKDNIKLFFNPLPQGIPDIDNIVNLLDKEFTKDNATLDRICMINEDYTQSAETLYEKTLEQKEPLAKKGKDEYPGSDIYDFFKSKVKDYCIKEGQRNILFIITDGYMYMGGTNQKKPNNTSNYLLSKELGKWGFNESNYETKLQNEGYKFEIPVTGLDNLEVFVVGLSPKNSWELDVLQAYWSTWMKDMGVKNFQDGDNMSYLKKADLPSEIEGLIADFIQK